MWLEPDTNPVRAGTDLHMLMTSLFEHYDARLALAARRRHIDTIRTLRRQLERPQNCDVDSTAGGALALLLSEIYVMTSSGLGTWKKHIHGIGAILRSISSTKKPTRLGMFLFKAFRTCGLMFSFLLRQSLDLDSKGMIPHAPSGSIEQLMCLAIRLPPLLERTDKLKIRQR
ncbi:hypothetical protein EJ03DRAFT_123763 [Teratosphaeria nubilosa]|uniref:Uncharacterized protein n=1 Tax=Teratosphaeria nubilosa TaxID=161662 RepID=A0A6G1LJU4_9PEZI|nr:hypothetical protein EJ03DRAFT_123763 [Teratosphaeria nubilosa]